MKIVTLHFDSDLEDPCSWDGRWKLYSFSRKHKSFKHPHEFFPEDEEPDAELKHKLDVGLAFVLSYYEHGGCAWSLAGEGMQCRWDSVGRAGLLVWEHPEADMGNTTVEARAKDARSFLDVYNAWANGQGFGYSITEEVLMPCGHTETNDLDSCFGFYSAEELKEAVIEALDGETEITLKGEAKDCFDVGDFVPKAPKPETHATH